MADTQTDWTPEYVAYHKAVVDACVALTAEEHRAFWDRECDYFDEFAEGLSPEDVAQSQLDSL